MVCKDVPTETMYDVLHDTEYRRKWDSNVIETFDIGKLTVNADVGYYSCKRCLVARDQEGGGGLLFFSFRVSSVCTGKCPKPLKNRDVITLRSWLPMGRDYIIMNYSVKHAVSKHSPASFDGLALM